MCLANVDQTTCINLTPLAHCDLNKSELQVHSLSYSLRQSKLHVTLLAHTLVACSSCIITQTLHYLYPTTLYYNATLTTQLCWGRIMVQAAVITAATVFVEWITGGGAK